MPSLTTAVISVTTLIDSPSLSTGGFFSLRIECLRNDKARTGRTQKSPRGAGNKKAAWRRLWFFWANSPYDFILTWHGYLRTGLIGKTYESFTWRSQSSSAAGKLDGPTIQPAGRCAANDDLVRQYRQSADPARIPTRLAGVHGFYRH